MTRSPMARRSWAALITATTLLLAACGGSGGDGNGNANLRILNATNDVASLDLYLGDNKNASAVANEAMTSSGSVEATSYTVKITNAGNPASLFTGSYSFSKDQHYTGVVWGRSGSLKFATLPEDDNTDNINSANSRVRVYNATSDIGAVDVYLTTTGQDDLGFVTPTAAAVAAGSLGGYKDLSAGDYRLRITGAGDSTDVRLDVPLLTLNAKQYSTLIVTAGPGGVLVNATSLIQQGALTPKKNTQARLRVVAGAEDGGTVTAALDGSTIASNLVSPRLGPYALVAAGSRQVDVRLNGNVVSSSTQTLAPGGDYTLLAFGSDGAPQTTLITDDNRLPSSGRYRMRLVNGAATSSLVTLSVGFAALVSDVPVGVASSFATGAAALNVQLDVNSTTGNDAIFSQEVDLVSPGVYTMFVLGGKTVSGASTPTGVLRKDR